MTNREKYKQAFSALHASDNISLEVCTMKKEKRTFHMRPVLAACLCVVTIMGCMGVAYAADVGGIRETIQIWINGRQVNANVDAIQDSDTGVGSYRFTIPEEGADTDAATVGGGGVEIDDDGSERPLTPEEVANEFANDVDVDKDGRVWLYYYEQSYDITDLFVNGACKVSLEGKDNTLYFDIEDNGGGGYAWSRRTEPTGSPSDYTSLQ